MLLYQFFKWCDATLISQIIRNSTYIFPVVEVLHLFGLTLLLGTVTVVDMRILGVGMRRQSISDLSSALTPWSVGAALLTIVTGILLFLSEAMKCYGNAAFPSNVVPARRHHSVISSPSANHPPSSRMSLRHDEGHCRSIHGSLVWRRPIAGRAIAFVRSLDPGNQ